MTNLEELLIERNSSEQDFSFAALLRASVRERVSGYMNRKTGREQDD